MLFLKHANMSAAQQPAQLLLYNIWSKHLSGDLQDTLLAGDADALCRCKLVTVDLGCALPKAGRELLQLLGQLAIAGLLRPSPCRPPRAAIFLQLRSPLWDATRVL